MFLNYHIYTGGSERRKRSDWISSDISLNHVPVIFSNDQIYAEESPDGIGNLRERRNVFDDITINGDPSIKFSCKYDRRITVDYNLDLVKNPEKIESDIMKTGILEYSASVHDTSMGHDHFSTVIIKPKHHLSNVYIS